MLLKIDLITRKHDEDFEILVRINDIEDAN